jgi:hypothetical protein
LLLLDGQVHHDTHALPMGNYVIVVGNYVIVSPSELGNYKIADTQARNLLRVQIVTGNHLPDVGVEVAHRVGELVMLEE